MRGKWRKFAVKKYGEFGGVKASQVEHYCPPLYPQDIIEFFHVPVYKNPSVLQEKYVQKGLSIAQIASECLSSKGAVRNGLLRAGIPIREKSKHHGHSGQPKFGKRIQKGTEVDLKVEQRVIDMILEMRKEGLGLRAIARCLTQMKVPTKKQGKSWHFQVVKQILDGIKN